jgi:hypothetical protein
LNGIGSLRDKVFPYETDLHVEHEFPSTKTAFQRLTEDDVRYIEETIAARFGGEELTKVQAFRDDPPGNMP